MSIRDDHTSADTQSRITLRGAGAIAAAAPMKQVLATDAPELQAKLDLPLPEPGARTEAAVIEWVVLALTVPSAVRHTIVLAERVNLWESVRALVAALNAEGAEVAPHGPSCTARRPLRPSGEPALQGPP